MSDYFEILQDDFVLVKNIKKTLQKKFSLSSYKDIDKAVTLANYLFCLGKIKESKELLDSFIFDVEYDEAKEDLWGAVGQGLVLSAYISDTQKNADERQNIISRVLANDIMTNRCSHYDLYLECKQDHIDNMARAEDETQKYKCEIYGQEALTFIYFYEILPFKDKNSFIELSKEIMNYIDSSYSYLRKNMK